MAGGPSVPTRESGPAENVPYGHCTSCSPLAADVVDRVSRLRNDGAHLKPNVGNKLIEHGLCIREHGDNIPEVRDWKLPY
jgi:phosphoketolase